jgi:hypothetical protein
VGVAAHVDRAWRLGSWDEFEIPRPFARITIAYSAPRLVPGTTPRERRRPRPRSSSTCARCSTPPRPRRPREPPAVGDRGRRAFAEWVWYGRGAGPGARRAALARPSCSSGRRGARGAVRRGVAAPHALGVPRFASAISPSAEPARPRSRRGRARAAAARRAARRPASAASAATSRACTRCSTRRSGWPTPTGARRGARRARRRRARLGRRVPAPAARRDVDVVLVQRRALRRQARGCFPQGPTAKASRRSDGPPWW